MPRASPRASKPGPRLALEAGTRSVDSAGTFSFIGVCGALDLDGRSFPARLVHRLHQLKRAITVFSGRERLPAGLYGFAEIQKLPLEGRERNRHRIGGAGSYVAI